MATVPEEIQHEVIRQQKAMGWPDQVPAYAFLPPTEQTVKRYENLTVAECEQLVEHHIRKAIVGIRRFVDLQNSTISPFAARRRCSLRNTAARSILLARLYRCRSISLMSKGATNGETSTEADMPFADWQLPLTIEEMELPT